jgi:uncharacterized protein (TIGR02996 family)
MHDEADFLRKLLENPADDATRLVYADWLDERADPESETKSEFLRITARLLEPNRSAGWREARLKELHLLAADLNTDWLAVVSRLRVEYHNCGTRWDELTTTEDITIRICEVCGQKVYYCDTIMTARSHVRQNHCVALDLGIIRRDSDLAPPSGVGGPRRSFARIAERERLRMDDVSRARERRKRENA